MNAGSTMARVYATLRMRVLSGDFAPGERLDPARLAQDLGASVTPIRDALHRLSGERLVDTWLHEGFRQPLVAEAGLRDLYVWSRELLGVVLRAAERTRHFESEALPRATGNYVEDVSELFAAFAARSGNFEHRFAIASLNDRLHLFRLVETRLIVRPFDDLAELASSVASGRWAEARRISDRIHRERLRFVPEIAAALRPRD